MVVRIGSLTLYKSSTPLLPLLWWDDRLCLPGTSAAAGLAITSMRGGGGRLSPVVGVRDDQRREQAHFPVR
eukprot:6176582-Pleurochrysis_carterae.AAC.2